MVKIRIGYVTGAVGLKGEIKVYSYLENIKLFQSLDRIFIDEYTNINFSLYFDYQL